MAVDSWSSKLKRYSSCKALFIVPTKTPHLHNLSNKKPPRMQLIHQDMLIVLLYPTTKLSSAGTDYNHARSVGVLCWTSVRESKFESNLVTTKRRMLTIFVISKVHIIVVGCLCCWVRNSNLGLSSDARSTLHALLMRCAYLF